MDKPLFYFAYGSNMNPTRIAMRIPNARDLGAASISGWKLTERLYADIDRKFGSTVWGVLYLVTKADLDILDRYEGVPNIYQRRKVRVHLRDACYMAVTYEMTPRTKIARHYHSYPESYRLLCSEGAESHHIPNGFLPKMNTETQSIPVAVYGTLLAGEPNAYLVPEGTTRTPCTITGTLYDTGYGYPAFSPSGTTSVSAELIHVSSTTFARLDRLEGYPNLYTRRVVPVTLPDGTESSAWVYIMRNRPRHATVIQGGSWSER